MIGRQTGPSRTTRPTLAATLICLAGLLGCARQPEDGFTGYSPCTEAEHGRNDCLILEVRDGSGEGQTATVLTQTEREITIHFDAGRPNSGDEGHSTGFIVELEQPVGTRTVIDHTSDRPVPRLDRSPR